MTPREPDEYHRHRHRPGGGGLHDHRKSSSAQEGVATGQTDDLSLKTLLLFGSGLSLWVVYGFFQKDVVIILANGVSLVILSVILYLKLTQS